MVARLASFRSDTRAVCPYGSEKGHARERGAPPFLDFPFLDLLKKCIGDVTAMEIVRASHADEYLLAFWTRESRPGKNGEFPPPDKRLERILGKYPYKFPCEGKKEVSWHICRVSSVAELGQLWMHRDDWLTKWRIEEWSHWLKDLADIVQRNKFFERPTEDQGSVRENYDNWKKEKTLKGKLDDHEKPLLVQYPYFTVIVDGWGRLLPYHVLVNEGMDFQPFQAFLAVPRYL
jgi:hypothetical protein